MTPAERKLAGYLLGLAANEFSNHGCNDLDLVEEVGLTPEESFQLRQQMREWTKDTGAPEERPDQHLTLDWLMMRFMRDLIKQE